MTHRPGWHCARAWRRHRWALPPLFLLIAARLLFLHGDPSDFPQDRNFNTAVYVTAHLQAHHFVQEFWQSLVAQPHAPPWLPEFPFAIYAAHLAQPFGLGVVQPVRLLALLASLATGWGLYRLGRQIGPPRLGLWALWLFALAPFSVFMGRAMLPDTWMVAGVVWMFVIACGTPAPGCAFKRQLFLVISLALCLLFTGLAKLPGLWFTPAVLLAWLAQKKSRPLSNILLVAILLLIAASLIAAWYHLRPWTLKSDLLALSANTNHLVGSAAPVAFASLLRVTLARLVLALTWPGLLLAIAGAILWQFRRRTRLWLTAWTLLSFLFVALTVKANAYWAYAALPAGVLLAAIVLEAAAARGRWVLAPLLAAIAVSIPFDPSLAWIGQDLAVQPAYQNAAIAARQAFPAPDDTILYHGLNADDLAFVSGRAGLDFTRRTPDAWREAINEGQIGQYLDMHLAAQDLTADLFRIRPVLETRPLQYILFDTRGTSSLGQPMAEGAAPFATNSSIPHPLELGRALTILNIDISPREPRPGDRLTIRITYAPGAIPESAPAVALDFVRDPSGETMTLVPFSGGAQLRGWSTPLLQTPDFQGTTRATMTYTFALPSAMPAGPYRLRWRLLLSPTQPLEQARVETAGPAFMVQPSPFAPGLPWRVNPFDAAWSGLLTHAGPSWLGRPHEAALLAGAGECWLGAPLPAGDYAISIRGRGIAAVGDSGTPWPRLRVMHSGDAAPTLLTFDRRYAMTATMRVHWAGPQDCLTLSLDNPYTTPQSRPALPLFVDERASIDRAIILDSMQWTPLR